MARTTLKIDDDLFRRIKRKAAAQGSTFQQVANEALRRGLAEAKPGTYRLEWEPWDATEQPGVDILDRDKLFDLMEGRR